MEPKDTPEKDHLESNPPQDEEQVERPAARIVESDEAGGPETPPETAEGPDLDLRAANRELDRELDFDLHPAERELDFDVRPSEAEADIAYDHRKPKGNPLTIWIGILAVAALVALTYFAFQGPSSDGPAPEDALPSAAAPSGVTSEPTAGALPEKVADAADFSPTPQMEAQASAPASLPAATSSSVPSTATGKTASAKPAESKPAAKPAETKPAETKPAAKPAETKPAEAKPAETKSAETASAETKPADEKTAEAKPTETASAEAKPTAVGESPEISELWVVNISSTPDSAESLRLLNRILASGSAGGQVYVYETSIDGRDHHRIRVGFFTSRADAEAVGQRLKEEYKLSATPWAVKPTVEEVKKYQKK